MHRVEELLCTSCVKYVFSLVVFFLNFHFSYLDFVDIAPTKSKKLLRKIRGFAISSEFIRFVHILKASSIKINRMHHRSISLKMLCFDINFNAYKGAIAYNMTYA